MSQRFHINKNGVPAVCRAKPGNCPLGGDENHYTSKDEAQKAADSNNEREFGILSVEKDKNSNKVNDKKKPDENKELTHKVAVTPKNFMYIERRKKEIKRQDYDKQKYIERCKSTERLENYEPNSNETFHYKEERSHREEKLAKEFGEGEIVGHYKVNHLVGRDKPKYIDQVVEVRDTGQIKVYDANTGRTVTTFMAHRQRIEVMMLLAGEMPQEKWMKKVNQNRNIATEKDLNFE